MTSSDYDYDTPSYIGGVYWLWGYNASSDVAVSVEACVARCRDVPPTCPDSCSNVCLPGSGTVAADAPAPELGVPELAAFVRALAHAGGVPVGHASLLSIQAISFSLAGATMASQREAEVCGNNFGSALRSLGWRSTPCSGWQPYYGSAPPSCLAAVQYQACPLRYGALIAFQLRAPSALAPAVVANLRSAFALTGQTTAGNSYSNVQSLTVASTFVTLMQAAGLAALDLVVPLPRTYVNGQQQGYGYLDLSGSEGLLGQLHVTSTPATTDSAEAWYAPPPYAQWSLTPRQLAPPPMAPLGSCPGWPGSCAAGTTGRCQDPATRICYAATPGADACWQGGTQLCALTPPPPSPLPAAPLLPPPPVASPPPPPSDARTYVWSTRGAFKYGRPRQSPAPPLGWAAAESACVAVGGHLASVHSADEAAFIATTVLPDFYCAAPANPQCWNGCAMSCPAAPTCASGCGCAVYAWLGLQLELAGRRWSWTDGSALDYTAWACGAPADLFADTSGSARPFALMSNGGALRACASGSPPVERSGVAVAGLWTNHGLRVPGQDSYNAPASSLAPAFGKFMAGGAQAVCSTNVSPALYGSDMPYNAASNINYRDFPYDQGCLYTSSTTFVCKVPL